MATKRTTAKAKGASGRRTTAASSAPARPARPASRRQAAPASAARRRVPVPLPAEPSPVEEILVPSLSPSELYRKEKQRRSQSVKLEPDPLAEARREYLALLAAEAEKGKGGRPKGSGKKKEEPVEHDDE